MFINYYCNHENTGMKCVYITKKGFGYMISKNNIISLLVIVSTIGHATLRILDKPKLALIFIIPLYISTVLMRPKELKHFILDPFFITISVGIVITYLLDMHHLFNIFFNIFIVLAGLAALLFMFLFYKKFLKGYKFYK